MQVEIAMIKVIHAMTIVSDAITLVVRATISVIYAIIKS